MLFCLVLGLTALGTKEMNEYHITDLLSISESHVWMCLGKESISGYS